MLRCLFLVKDLEHHHWIQVGLGRTCSLRTSSRGHWIHVGLRRKCLLRTSSSREEVRGEHFRLRPIPDSCIKHSKISRAETHRRLPAWAVNRWGSRASASPSSGNVLEYQTCSMAVSTSDAKRFSRYFSVPDETPATSPEGTSEACLATSGSEVQQLPVLAIGPPAASSTGKLLARQKLSGLAEGFDIWSFDSGYPGGEGTSTNPALHHRHHHHHHHDHHRHSSV